MTSPDTEQTSETRRAGAFYGHWHVAGMAVGVLVVAVSYALSRDGRAGSTAVYWLGQLIVFGSAAAFATSPRLTGRSFAVFVPSFAIATAMTKWLYSPLRLKFPDELQHLLGTDTMLREHRFGVPNRALPISTDYPGLSVVAAVVHRITGLSLDATGLLLGVVFHVATVLLVSALLRRITGSLRIGAVAVAVYGCNASFGFFNSMFIYENLAIVFGLLALLCVVRAAGSRARPAAAGTLAVVLAVLSVVATIVTHHIAALALCAALAVVTITYSVRRAGRSAASWRVPAAAATLAIAGTAAWFSFVAVGTWSYLSPYTIGLTSSSTAAVEDVRPGSGRTLLVPDGPPQLEVFFAGAGLVVLFAACCWGGIVVIRRHRQIPWLFLGGAGALGALEIGRLVTTRGSEVAGRSSVFLYVLVAGAAALSLPLAAGFRRWVLVGGMSVAWVGALLIAWPSWWDRMPGGALVATQFERGADEGQNAAAYWVRDRLPTNAPIAADRGGLQALGTRGRHVGVASASVLFYSNSLTPTVLRQALSRNARYVWVNTRMPDTQSVDLSYYGNANVYSTAPTPAQLAKFDSAPGIDCVYDNGEIKIYDLTGREGAA